MPAFRSGKERVREVRGNWSAKVGAFTYRITNSEETVISIGTCSEDGDDHSDEVLWAQLTDEKAKTDTGGMGSLNPRSRRSSPRRMNQKAFPLNHQAGGLKASSRQLKNGNVEDLGLGLDYAEPQSKSQAEVQ